MKSKVLLNAIIGDVCGSIYEFNPIKEKPENLMNTRCNFTDDTVHTIAIADAILRNPENPDFASSLREWSNKYPLAGYGGMMCQWIDNPEIGPYNSFGNGSAMRVSACGWVYPINKYNHNCSYLLYTDPKEFSLAINSASVTHNHPEGIKGAQSLCDIISMLRKISGIHGSVDGYFIKNPNKYKIFTYIISNKYYPDYYPLNGTYPDVTPDRSKYLTLDERRPSYVFDETCQGTVPVAIQCVLEAESYEDAIKLAISMGGDADTMACIAGSIAGVIWWDKPDELVEFAYKRLPKSMIEVIEKFDDLIKFSQNG